MIIFLNQYLKLSEEEQRLWEKVDINSYDTFKKMTDMVKEEKKSKVLNQIREVLILELVVAMNIQEKEAIQKR